MKILLVSFLSAVIFGGILYVFIILPVKKRSKKLNQYADEIHDNLRNSGVDKYYDSLKTEKLQKIYEELNKVSYKINFKKDLYSWAEVGCKAKLIEDIFNARGVTIPKWK